jgi:predicted NBD/HSP70 family sugar kinase
MTTKKSAAAAAPAMSPIGVHGASELPSIVVKSYNISVRDKDGFIGDKASGRAFRTALQDWRKTLRKMGKDPFTEDVNAPISKKKLDKFLATGDADAAAVVHGAIEDFATNFADVIERFMKQKSWLDTTTIIVGGGLSAARVGELAVARAHALLETKGLRLDLRCIRYHPDEAGLVGCLHLAPSWMFDGYQGIVAIDIGGSNIRCGIVLHNSNKDRKLRRAAVHTFELWRHADEEKVSRTGAVERLVAMIRNLIAGAESEGILLAPFIGIACPGLISADGSIKKGAQNLPGNWEKPDFRLPDLMRNAIPRIGKHDTMAVMHNDAVIQGLSERPWMTKTPNWAALTIGTGLGNASYRNRS